MSIPVKIFPEFRNENSMREYPFMDGSSLLDDTGSMLDLTAILDVFIAPVSLAGDVVLQQFNGIDKTIVFADSGDTSVTWTASYGEGDMSIYESKTGYYMVALVDGWYSVVPYRRAVGYVVVDPDYAYMHAFTDGISLCPSCVAKDSVHSIDSMAVDTVVLSGNIAFKGEHGILVYGYTQGSDKVLVFNAIGDVPGTGEDCGDIPPGIESICVEQQLGSSLSYSVITVATISTQGLSDVNYLPYYDVFSEEEANGYVGFLVELAITGSLDHEWSRIAGVNAATHSFLLETPASSLEVDQYWLVQPNMLQIGHNTIDRSPFIMGIVLGWEPDLYSVKVPLVSDDVVGALFKSISSGCYFIAGQTNNSGEGTTTLRLDTPITDEPVVGEKFGLYRTEGTTIDDVCLAKPWMVGDELVTGMSSSDPCDEDPIPPELVGVCKTSDGVRCLYPLNGEFWILAQPQYRTVVRIDTDSIPVDTLIDKKDGTVAAGTSNRGTVIVKINGLKTT